MEHGIEITTPTASTAVVSLTGEHDLGDYVTLKVALARAAIRSRNVIVDLSRCSFIDSTVISVVLSAHSLVVRDGGGFGVALPMDESAIVSRALNVMQVAQLVPCHATLDAALDSFPESRMAAD
jgi:anti-anti-sigma factor